MDFGDDELYRDHILEHYEEPYHRGRCAHPTHAHQGKNPLCGDVVHIDLSVGDNGKIREIYFDGSGCCISQAAASMLMEHIDGKTVDDIKQFTANDMIDLFGARLTPLRQKCCLLSWRVLQTAIHAPLGTGGDERDGAVYTDPGADKESP